MSTSRLRSSFTTAFPAEPVQIRTLRRWAKAVLPKLGLDGRQQDAVRDDLELVLSELGANAIVHGCGGDRPDVQLTASLTYTPGTLRVSVTDPGPGRPQYRTADDEATCGRGLRLVMAHAARFGIEDLPDGGKEVWVELELPAPAQPTASAAAVEPIGLRVAALRSAAVLRESRPRPAVGTLPPGRPELDRIPA
ncbi:ATP-binding protein [Kitasatospora sp. NPDC056651]|uniref:ATP-binding protein n=1 Tax=Kitasatospora sp. NPDC056651 TaxID=3345892 RepID=UPI0036A2ED25